MRLTIRARLIAVLCLSLLPIALLGYLFVAQSQKDIAFGSKEIDGTRYYAALASDLTALTGDEKLPPDDRFSAVRIAYDLEMSSAPLADGYAALRDKARATYSSDTTAALLA